MVQKLSLTEFVQLAVADKAEAIDIEFKELTSDPTKYSMEEYIGRIKAIADQKDNLVRDTLKGLVKKVEVVKVTVTDYELKVGEDSFTAISEVKTSSVSGLGSDKTESTSFKDGDKVVFKYKGFRSPTYTVTDGKVELDGVISPASHIVGQFIEQHEGKVTTIINGSGSKTYKVNGLSHNGWELVKE